MCFEDTNPLGVVKREVDRPTREREERAEREETDVSVSQEESKCRGENK